MKLRKQFLLSVLSFVLLPAAIAVAQIGNTTTIVFPGVPSGKCQPTQLGLNKSNGDLYSCSNGSWVKQGGTGVGTVTNVSGTANQIDVASGTTTPTVSLDPLTQYGTGTSVAQTGVGQVAGSQLWLQPGLSTVTPTAANSGGTILTGHLVAWAYTLNTTLGETLPSDTTTMGMSTLSAGACVSTVCTTSIAPTVPTGYTGYTAYFCDISVGACPAPRKVLACVNITGTCTVTAAALNSGVALPTINTAYVAPANVQNTLCASSIVPSVFAFKADGNSYTEQGMDFSNGSPLPAPNGTAVWCDRFFITDSKQTIADATQQGAGLMRNAMVSLSHLSGATTSTGSTTDDRVITVRGTDSPTSPTYEQWLGYYGEQFTYNNNFSCAPVGGAVGEDCMAAIRARADDVRPAGVNAITLVGIHGTASTDVAAPKVGGGVPAVTGVMGSAEQSAVVSQNGNAAIYAGVWGNMAGSSSNTNGSGVALGGSLGAVRFATQNIGLYLTNSFSGANAIDYSIRSEGTARSGFAGAIYLGGNPALATGAGTLNVTGSFLNTGSLGTTQFATPTFANGNIITTGTPGGTTYTYKIVAKDGNGNTTAASAAGTTTTGNATLNGSNFNRIQLNLCNTLTGLSANIIGWSTVDVYRTASGGTPSSTGKIGTIVPTYVGGNSAYGTCNFTLDDTGLAGDSGTPPTANSTDGLVTPGYSALNGNKTFVTSNFTTAANTSLQTITGLVFNLVPAAGNYQFHCSLSYSQATGNAAVAFGIQAATVNPTNVFAHGTMQTNTTAFSAGTLATLATTTATNIVSATPGATATNFVADLDGTIEEPANDQGQVLNFMVSTATSADAVTVLRGSYCYLY